jgi:hypothetical protein
MSPEIAWFVLALIGAGLFAGFVGGLFGIGGGAVIVPALYFVFTALGVDEAVRMHVAVGTSLSTIISTSWRSLATHTKAGAVDFDVLRAWAPWITLGALTGAALAGFANTGSAAHRVRRRLVAGGAADGLFESELARFSELPSGIARALIAGGIGAALGDDGDRRRRVWRDGDDVVRPPDPSGGGDGLGLRRGDRAAGGTWLHRRLGPLGCRLGRSVM